MYATTEELKKKAFRINIQNIQQTTGIQMIFISETKSQKENVLANVFPPTYASILNPC